MKIASRNAMVALAVGGSIVLGGCGGPAGPGSAGGSTTTTVFTPTSPVVVSESGSSVAYGAVSGWASHFHALNPKITLSTKASGSAAGMALVQAAKADLAVSGAPLPPPAQGAQPGGVSIPLAATAVQVDYNVPGVPTGVHLKLTGPILADIFVGNITYWDSPAIKAINPQVALPHLRIVPIHQGAGAATFIFTNFLSAAAGATWNLGYNLSAPWPALPGALSALSDTSAATQCATTKGCLTYQLVPPSSQSHTGHPEVATIANGNGNYVLPTAVALRAEVDAAGSPSSTGAVSLAMLSSAAGYPIEGCIYAILPTAEPSPAEAGAVSAFVNWALDPAGGSSRSELSHTGLVALSGKLAKASRGMVVKVSGQA